MIGFNYYKNEDLLDYIGKYVSWIDLYGKVRTDILLGDFKKKKVWLNEACFPNAETVLINLKRMNAFQLRQLLNDIEASGQDLNDLPVLCIENNKGIQITENDITVVNVKKFNEESDTLTLQTQFDKAIIVGPVIEIE
jgi:hypothetical protein